MLKSAPAPSAMLPLPVLLTNSALSTVSRILDAGCVVSERSKTVGRVALPVVLLRSAFSPLAVFLLPVVLLRRA